MIPALIRRFHEAKVRGAKEVVVWGTGNARREFLHVDDMVDACLFVMNWPNDEFRKELLSYPKPCFLNVGSSEDVSIRGLAKLITEVVEYKGTEIFDNITHEGVHKKLLDIKKLSCRGWKSKISLRVGLHKTFKWYKDNYLKYDFK